MVSKTDALGCNAIDGKLIVAGANGKPPYLYKINGGTFQANPEFANLGSGTYSVTVKDANECSKSIDVAIDAANSTLNASIVAIGSSLCSSPNGSATINGTGGTPPYSYLFSTGGFVTSNVFANLKPGTYSASIKDALDCVKTFSVQIQSNTGTKLSSQIKPIIDTNCAIANCHGGNQSPSLATSASILANASRIKVRTSARTMPPSGQGTLSQAQIDLIACWVDDGAPNN